MLKLSSLMISALYASQIFAGTLTCHLTDDKTGTSIQASINVKDKDAVAYTEGELGDISFNLDSPVCDRKNGVCEVNCTFNSSTIEDEVGQTTVKFSSRQSGSDVYVEPITDVNDKNLSYRLHCDYSKR